MDIKKFEPGFSDEGRNEADLIRDEAISSGISAQEDLSPKEKVGLLKMMRERNLQDIQQGVLAFNGKELSLDEAAFIAERSTALALGHYEVLGELIQKFPDLEDYFRNILDKLDEMSSNKE